MSRAYHSPKKAGPQTEFAWQVDTGVKAYQQQRRLATLELAQNEIANAAAIGLRTLQAWRCYRRPQRYEDLLHFAQACAVAAPELGARWITELFRSAELACYADQALREVGLNDRTPADNSTESLRARLVDTHYLPPKPIFEQVQLPNFAGRAWLDAKVDAFLRDRQYRSGVFVLTGEAGIGKTTYLAHLVHDRQYLHVFGELVKCQVSRAQRSLAVQLLQRYRLELNADDERDCLDHSDLFLQRMLRQAAQQLKPGEQIVISIDVCFEWEISLNGTLLDLPVILPAGVYLLVSHNPGTVPLHFHGQHHTERLHPASVENLADIRQYMHHMAQHADIAQHLAAESYSLQDFEQVLIRQCGANWASTQCAMQHLSWGRRTLKQLMPVPISRAIYHTEHLGAWREDWEKWDRLYAPLMATLAAIQEPLPVEQIIHWAGVTTSVTEVKRLLRECWCSFVREHHDPDWRWVYAFSYGCLHEFVSGNVEREGLPPACSFLIEDLQERAIEAHRRIADDLRDPNDSVWSQLRGREYAERYMELHVARSKVREEVRTGSGKRGK